jgi:hypothetical protein
MKKAFLIFQFVLSTHLLFAQANCLLPKITTQPVSTISECVGGAISLAVQVESTSPVIYEWKKNNIPILNSNSPDLFLSPLTATDVGSYQVKVTNSCGEVFSTPSQVNVILNTTPNVALVSDKFAICEQESISLTAFPMSGGANPLFTFRDGLNIVGTKNQAANTLTLSNLTPGEHAISVEMESNASCITIGSNRSVSVNINIEVDANPEFPKIGQDVVICSDCYQLNAGISSDLKCTWTTTNNAIISFADGSNATVCNIPKNSSTTVSCFVQSKLGLCPSTSSQVIISRVGDITYPAVSSQSKTIGINDPAPILVSPLLASSEAGTWTAFSPATITANGQTGNLQTGGNVFRYTISNGICPPVMEEVIITVDPVLGTDNGFSENSLFTISTDPIDNETFISLKELHVASFRVIDLNGNTKKESNIQPGEKTRLDKNLPSGLYVLLLSLNNKIYSQKILVR